MANRWTYYRGDEMTEDAKQNGQARIEHIVITSEGKRRKPRTGDDIPHKTCPRCSGESVENGRPVFIQQLRRAETEGMFTRWVCKECGESVKIPNHKRLAELSKQPPLLEELPISRERDG